MLTAALHCRHSVAIAAVIRQNGLSSRAVQQGAGGSGLTLVAPKAKPFWAVDVFVTEKTELGSGSMCAFGGGA